MKKVYISKLRDFCGNFIENDGVHNQNLIVYAVLSLITNLIYSNEYIKYTFVVVCCRSPPERFEIKSNFSGGFYYYGRR